MSKLLYTLLLLFPALLAAQNPNQPGGQPRPGQVSGIVLDAKTGQPIEYAVVSLFRGNDSVPAAGSATDAKGAFQIPNLALGAYRAKVTFIGYETQKLQGISLTAEKPVHVIPPIKLGAGVKEMKEVEVTGEKRTVETSIDKRVYNVGKDLTSVGGTVTDVLQNVPSVSVDMDRKIQLRGSDNVHILIDGKASTLANALDQMPASQIEKIEVITNPSAKYDPDGVSGIINIITKHPKQGGINGTANLVAGTGDKYSGGLSLNYRSPKVNLYTNVNVTSHRFWHEGDFDRQNRLPNIGFNLNQTNTTRSGFINYAPSMNLDFYPNKRNTFGLSGNYSYRPSEMDNEYTYSFIDKSDGSTRPEYRSSIGKGLGINYEGSAYWKRKFADPEKQLSADVTYSAGKGDDNMTAYQQFPGTGKEDSTQYTHILKTYRFLTSQINFTQPLKGGRKLELGAKNVLREFKNDFQSRHMDTRSDVWVPDLALTNNVGYTEGVYSAYGVFSGSVKKVGYSLGLRAEQTLYALHQYTLDQKFPRQYFNFFPSAHFKYNLSETKELGLSYSKRINRPNIETLNPFPDYADPYNLMVGNPDIKPELTHSVELSYRGYLIKGLMVSPSVFYRYTDNTVTRYRYLDSNGVSIVTFVNAAKEHESGLDLTLQYELTKWWNLNGNISYFYNQVDASNVQAGLSNNGFTGWSRVMTTIRPTKVSTVQMTYNYMFPFVIPQGRGKMGSGLDVSYKHDFLKEGRMSLTMRLTDVFNTRKFFVTTEDFAYYGTATRKRESRILYVGLSYRFGKPMKERAPRPRQDDGGGGGFEGGF